MFEVFLFLIPFLSQHYKKTL